MRTGKPIKNKKRRDPRYFLHEDQEKQLNEFLPMPGGGGGVMEMVEKLSEIKEGICEYKKIIIFAVRTGTAVGLAEKFGGKDVAAAMQVIDQLLGILQLPSLEALAKDKDVQEMVVMAITTMCMF